MAAFGTNSPGMLKVCYFIYVRLGWVLMLCFMQKGLEIRGIYPKISRLFLFDGLWYVIRTLCPFLWIPDCRFSDECMDFLYS